MREFAEELGIEVAADHILDCWVYEILPQRRVVIVTYAVRRLDHGALRVSAEHRRCGWFAIDELEVFRCPKAIVARSAPEPRRVASRRRAQDRRVGDLAGGNQVDAGGDRRRGVWGDALRP
jgi:hypothetical protein